MAELNAHIPTLCQNPEHVISFIENHAQVFQKTLGTSHDLASIMSSIRRWEVTAQQATQLNEIIKEKHDIVSIIIRDRMGNIEQNYEVAQFGGKERKRQRMVKSGRCVWIFSIAILVGGVCHSFLLSLQPSSFVFYGIPVAD